MAGLLGPDYTATLRAAYKGRVPGGADLVCFWFEKGRDALEQGRTVRVGLVATNSIRGGANRRVLDRIVREGNVFAAWSDEPWSLDGAAVRVSLVCFALADVGVRRLDGAAVATIRSDLSADAADLTTARRLLENKGVAFNGIQKTGPFEVPGSTARAWLSLPYNPNGRPNADVVRPYWNGIDATRRSRDSWIVDFGPDRTEYDAAFFSAPFNHVAQVVKPVRELNSLEPLRRLWWRHWRPRGEMREAIALLPRFIVTPEVSKHRVFVWLAPSIGPDKNLIVIARSDDTTFGILHSRFHQAWALKLCTWLGVGNDPRYTPSSTFETYPFPSGLTPDLPMPDEDGNTHVLQIGAAARALVQARDNWLNPPELVLRIAEVGAGFPDRIVPKDDDAAAILKKRTLTALYNTRGTPEGTWLDNLHRDLDAAVALAYGWPADISEEDALSRLLTLNLARAPA